MLNLNKLIEQAKAEIYIEYDNGDDIYSLTSKIPQTPGYLFTIHIDEFTIETVLEVVKNNIISYINPQHYNKYVNEILKIAKIKKCYLYCQTFKNFAEIFSMPIIECLEIGVLSKSENLFEVMNVIMHLKNISRIEIIVFNCPEIPEELNKWKVELTSANYKRITYSYHE